MERMIKMAKIQVKNWNDFCPQQLFLYGTYKEDGTPDFGLFCWFSYIWTSEEDYGGEGLGVMAAIGAEKLTKDLIRKNGVFSANLVTEELLPLADYYGNVEGRYNPDKMKYMPTVEKGTVLNVPTIAESPVSMELQVIKEINMANGSDVFLCKIMGETVKEELTNKEIPFIERFKTVKQVLCGGEERYVSMDGRDLGPWGEPMKTLTEA